MAHVEMYTTMTCPWCVRAKRLLAARGVNEIEEIDVSDDRTSMVERTGGASTVPQIFIDGTHVGGYDSLVEHDRDGRLATLIAGGTG